LVISHTVAWAVTTNNVVNTPGTFSDYSLLEPPQVAQTWPEMARDEFDTRSTVVFSDSFGWQSTTRWLREENHGRDLNVSYANAGKSAMQHAVLNSLRESLVKVPGIFESKNWFENLIIGTFAQTTEESIKSTRQTPIAAQMTWWDDIRSNNTITYGFRPLDGYFYGSARFGHWGDGRSIGAALIRCHYDPILLRSSIDEQISFFLPWSSALTFGSSYELASLHDNSNKLNWSVSITHAMGKGWYNGLLFASLSSDDHELLASAGFHKSF